MNIVTHNHDPFEAAWLQIKQVKDTNTAAIQEIAAMVEQMEAFGKLMDCAGIPRMCQDERPLSFWQRLDMYFKAVK